MEQLINLVINNGLGVASFVALMYFMNGALKEIKETLVNINNSLISIQNSMIRLSDRVDILEEKINSGKGK